MNSSRVRIAISACLMGEQVRYHGGHARVQSKILDIWNSEGRLVLLCPEMLAGFGVPRPPSEIEGNGGLSVLAGNGRVIKHDGRDVTEQFSTGASRLLSEISSSEIRVAILKDGSPSCGTSTIYDGTFSGRRIPGRGVAASLLDLHGIRIFSEGEIAEAWKFVKNLEEERS